MCKKFAQKLEVLNRISSLLNPEKKISVIKSHFSYSLLICMFSPKSNNLINQIHERSIRPVYKQHISRTSAT